MYLYIKYLCHYKNRRKTYPHGLIHGGGGAYILGGGVYTRKGNCVSNLGGLYTGELIHGGGGLFTELYGSIICILLDIPCKPKTKLQNVVIKPPSRNVIVEWILSAWNYFSCETIRKSFKSCALTTALDGDEDDQIHYFKSE